LLKQRPESKITLQQNNLVRCIDLSTEELWTTGYFTYTRNLLSLERQGKREGQWASSDPLLQSAFPSQGRTAIGKPSSEVCNEMRKTIDAFRDVSFKQASALFDQKCRLRFWQPFH